MPFPGICLFSLNSHGNVWRNQMDAFPFVIAHGTLTARASCWACTLTFIIKYCWPLGAMCCLSSGADMSQAQRDDLITTSLSLLCPASGGLCDWNNTLVIFAFRVVRRLFHSYVSPQASCIHNHKALTCWIRPDKWCINESNRMCFSHALNNIRRPGARVRACLGSRRSCWQSSMGKEAHCVIIISCIRSLVGR